jgi:NitT/TauT family transport system permease protein
MTSGVFSAPRARRAGQRPRHRQLRLRLAQLALLFWLFVAWYLATARGLHHYDAQARLFLGEPREVAGRLVAWFVRDGDIYPHLGVTLVETLLAFALGSLFGLGAGLWLGCSERTAALLEPYLSAANAMPRIILAPIFGVWLGLGIASKVALGITLVFFTVFYNVHQGVRQVDPVVLASVRMLGASRWQLLRHVYLPSALGFMFGSLHSAVGLAFVGAVVGEYLGSALGVGYLIHQAEGVFDASTVVAGILLLTACALCLDAAVTQLEKRLLHWRPRAHARELL